MPAVSENLLSLLVSWVGALHPPFSLPHSIADNGPSRSLSSRCERHTDTSLAFVANGKVQDAQ